MDDSVATVAQMKDLVRAFCEERDWDMYHNPKDLAIGMVTEASELLDIFRFKSPGDIESIMSDPVRSAHVREELSDVLYFALRFAQMNGIDMYTELVRKIGIDAGKYPVERSRGSNLKYDELRRHSRQSIPGGNRRTMPSPMTGSSPLFMYTGTPASRAASETSSTQPRSGRPAVMSTPMTTQSAAPTSSDPRPPSAGSTCRMRWGDRRFLRRSSILEASQERVTVVPNQAHSMSVPKVTDPGLLVIMM